MDEYLNPPEDRAAEDEVLKYAEERISQLQILVAELLLQNQLLRSRSDQTT